MMRNAHKVFLSNNQELRAAAELINDDNLVWDEDFEGIRKDLATWLLDEARKGNHANTYALTIARKLNRGW
jgi:hypothetical protein